MAVSSVIYANTVAYSAMGSMLTNEKFQRLLDCKNEAELKKCLTEFAFEGDSTDEMFNNALDKIYAYLEENSPIAEVLSAFKKKNDYHNAKVMVKCKYVRREITKDLLYPHGEIDTERMKEYVLKDEYSLLPAPMSEAMEKIDYNFSQGHRSGRIVDLFLTKAMYADIFDVLKSSKYAELKEIFKSEIDFANISCALRIRKSGLNEASLWEEFIPGGNVSYEKVSVIFSGSEEDVKNTFMLNNMSAIVLSAYKESSNDALVDFERMADDHIIDIICKYRHDTGAYMLFYGYILAKLYELKNVRIVCGGVKAGKDKNEIRAKLRKLYVG